MIARPETTANQSDIDQVTKLFEIELAQKRATWRQTKQRNQSLRSVAFLFLFLLIVGCLAGAYLAFTRVNEQRSNPRPAAAIHR